MTRKSKIKKKKTEGGGGGGRVESVRERWQGASVGWPQSGRVIACKQLQKIFTGNGGMSGEERDEEWGNRRATG